VLSLTGRFKALEDPGFRESRRRVDVGQRLIRNLAGASDSGQPEAGIFSRPTSRPRR